ncbi:MAG TPA: putative toxin-antitoxin system toxin component, PIN family [Tepidisphaeraceae bacterium]|jgi:putative PIN family toxin of toxin-antitoxin system|nr:putative toxin-antitoxin system toxin component, PIN family [Tepidisphaeraceae bacterium]
MSPITSVVFDCNVFLQSMLSSHGAAHACWERVLAGEVKLYVTAYILAEIRKLPEHRKLRRFRNFTAERVERYLEEVLKSAVLVPTPAPEFTYSRDPDDAHYVNLAIATGALLVVSNDKDLLDLMLNGNTDGDALRAKHPQLRILTPPQFLADLSSSVI